MKTQQPSEEHETSGVTSATANTAVHSAQYQLQQCSPAGTQPCVPTALLLPEPAASPGGLGHHERSLLCTPVSVRNASS